MSTPNAPLPTVRADLLARLAPAPDAPPYDLAVIGGGATGLGVALDAAARGFSVVLLESHDFAKGTSSRATKLVHGGVRYLAQGNISLVREALRERTHLLRNAPHLAQPLPFVMPGYKLWETPFYGVGLKAYDALAGSAGLGATEFLSARATRALLPNVQTAGLCGGVKYWDGQFDDARLALALARSAAARGALLLNYCRVERLLYQDDKVCGLVAQDTETGRDYAVQARCVVNATGVWADALRRADGQARGRQEPAMIAPSQGVHLVVDRDFWPCDHALLVPKTTDGRVLFAVPWLGKTILGTTDTPRHDLAREPRPFREEVDFILREAGRYLARAPRLQDVRSTWVGLRPLVKPAHGDGDTTKKISREHTVLVSASGLVTVTGGKWTTYRAMAEDVLDQCFDAHLLPRRAGDVTTHLPLVGAEPGAAGNPKTPPLSAAPGWHLYGGEAPAVQALPGAERELGLGLTEAMVRHAVRHEYARTVEDVLARRSRLLFLDAALAAALAPRVAELLAGEGVADAALPDFQALAGQYASPLAA
ncbi:MAG: Aerobic glycerol-3-phosphate dehydrogenase [Paracidovorax wautersii]|uniref:Aerobic glycerol-3-phosphate dehydrogenase n=1 Tax=Paracidovorax wautersii TaxID=1177982 RepID=A0A7V8FL60_9BURK|nr:MAG: Aerobic glycerol-3-phosphate dehydrogenase [Paracidovorax wautersii]